MVKFFSLFFRFLVAINAEQFELDYLFPWMIFEPAWKLTPSYKQGIYSYTFELPLTSKFDGPHIAFYLFAGQLPNKTAEIVINQDGQFFQTLTEKQYWQSNKIPLPLTINKTTIDLHIRDGGNIGPTYIIHVTRGTE